MRPGLLQNFNYYLIVPNAKLLRNHCNAGTERGWWWTCAFTPTSFQSLFLFYFEAIKCQPSINSWFLYCRHPIRQDCISDSTPSPPVPTCTHTHPSRCYELFLFPNLSTKNVYGVRHHFRCYSTPILKRIYNLTWHYIININILLISIIKIICYENILTKIENYLYT